MHVKSCAHRLSLDLGRAMATTAMVGARSSAPTATAGVPRAGVVTQARSCSSIDSAAGLPGLRLPAKSRRSQSCQLRSEFLPSFKVSTPFLRRRSDRSEGGKGGALTSTSFASDPDQLRQAKEDIKKLLAEKKPYGIFIRLGWHDSGSYDKKISAFPKRGGANGSIRFSEELNHGANAGLVNAVNLLAEVKEKYPGITHADLYQLASATAIEDAGGPKIPMRYGRVDTVSQEDCAIEGNLPDGDPPNPPDHLRKIFYRMDFTDQEIVALSGAHTIGRSRPERSGFGKAETKYTNPKDKNIGSPGGQSWTVEWLKFDNSYFKDIKAQADEDLLVLPTDRILTEDPGFKPHTERYAADQEVFFNEYAAAHAKLSELGSQFDPPEGFTLDEETAKAPKAEKFVAANYSSGETKSELSDTMKDKIRAEYLAIGGSPNKPLRSNYFLNIIIIVGVLAVISSIITQNQPVVP